jgi:hypothetical protein
MRQEDGPGTLRHPGHDDHVEHPRPTADEHVHDDARSLGIVDHHVEHGARRFVDHHVGTEVETTGGAAPPLPCSGA